MWAVRGRSEELEWTLMGVLSTEFCGDRFFLFSYAKIQLWIMMTADPECDVLSSPVSDK